MPHPLKLALWMALALVSLIAAGCEEDDETSTQSVTLVYVANAGGTISGFYMENDSGALSEVSGSPFPAQNPQELAFTEDGGYLVIRGNGTISLKRVDASTGRLSAVPGTTQNVSMPGDMSLITPENFIFVTDNSGQAIRRYQLDAGAGDLIALSNHSTSPDQPSRAAYDAAGGYYYAVAPISTEVLSFSVNPADGVLASTPGVSLVVGTAPGLVKADPQGEYIAVFDGTPQGIFLLQIEPDGDVVNMDFITVGSNVFQMAFHPTLDLLYTVSSEGISTFRLDRTGSALSEPDPPQAIGSGPNSIAFTPNASHMIVTDGQDSIAQVFALDGAGVPTEVDGSPFDTGNTPVWAATFDPTPAE